MIGPFVSEEFDHAAKAFRQSHYADENVILAALRIAANVMRPGFIEAAVTQRLNDESSPTDDDLSVAIRAVLLGNAGT